MITLRNNPVYVNRVQEPWQQGGGVSSSSAGDDPFAQLGPTLDLVFAGVPNNLGENGPSLDLYLYPQQYQIAAQYSIWENGAGFVPKNFGGIITFTRASPATYFDSAGVLQTATTDVPRFDYDPSTLAARGLLIEEARTNLLLHNRDLTNVAWVATNITPLKNQTGIDGVTNSASLITATSANGTILQSVTSASAARFTSAYVKRVTGTGTIEMTQDGGSTWASVSVTSAWTRVNIASATITNPSVGFRIVDSGDEIAVDGVQLETGSFATSVIFTTSATVGRAFDAASVNTLSPWFNSAEGTLYAEALPIATAAAAVASIDDGTSANTINITSSNDTGTVFFGLTVANVNQLTSSSRAGTTLPFKAGIAYKTNDTSWTINGTTPTDDVTVNLPSVTEMNIGSRGAGSIRYSGHIRRITYYPRRLSNTELQAITA